jgi:hypothetical protein
MQKWNTRKHRKESGITLRTSLWLFRFERSNILEMPYAKGQYTVRIFPPSIRTQKINNLRKVV